MNPTKIEMISISKLKDVLERCERIRTFISENDKTPSWDGSIQLYKTTNLKKEDLQGVVQVQVKGKKVTSLNDQEISYSVDVADLKNFRSVGGTVFFVVYILDYDNYKIYYNALLPLDLEQIFQTKLKQKTKTIRLIEFPKDDLMITYMFLNYIEDSRKQQSNAKIDIIRNVNNSQFDNFTFSIIGPKGPYDDYIFKNPVYIYGQIEGLNIDIPLDKIKIESLTNEMKKQVKINGEIFYNEISIEKGIDIFKVQIGAGFEIDFKTSKFNYIEKGSLKERIYDLKALITLIKNKFVINIAGLESKKIKINENDSKIFEKRLEYYNSLQELMIKLDVKDEINLNILDESEQKELETFTNSFMNKVPVSLTVDGENTEIFLGKFKFANLVVAVLVKRVDGENYLLENLFNEESRDCIMKRSEAEDGTSSSIYLVLKKEDFIEVSNINYENVIRSLFSVPYSEEYGEAVNLLLLEMLKAFDEKDSASELIDIIITIAKWLTVQENKNYIYKLNYLQALKRSRNLNEEENHELIVMKMEELEKGDDCNFTILSGISILLGNKAEFEYYFKKIERNDQDNFKEFPIYTFVKK